MRVFASSLSQKEVTCLVWYFQTVRTVHNVHCVWILKLEVFTLRNLTLPLLGKESLACHCLGWEDQYGQLLMEGKEKVKQVVSFLFLFSFFFLNVTVLLWLIAYCRYGSWAKWVSHIHVLCAPLHTFFWSLKVLFGCWVLGWSLLCSQTGHPGALLHVSRPHLIVLWQWKRSQRGWQKQTEVNFGNVTMSFVCFTRTFSSATAPGCSSPLS